MRNPVTQARERLGLSRRDLAVLSNADYHLIHSIERGLLNRPPASVMKALADLGVDAKSVTEDYRQYREALRLELLKIRSGPSSTDDRKDKQAQGCSSGSNAQ